MENLRQLQDLFIVEAQPMLYVVSHVVPKERPHGKWIVHDRFPLVLCCGRCLGPHCRCHKDTMLPVESFIHQWHTSWSSAAEDQSTDWNALRTFPIWIHDRALVNWSAETGVRMSSGCTRLCTPILISLPVCYGHILWDLFFKSWQR